MRETVFWTVGAEGARTSVDTCRTVRMTDRDMMVARTGEIPSSSGVELLATAPGDGACGVVLVGDSAHGRARLNGVRLPAGVHPARHGDSVSLAGAQAWFAVSVEPDTVRYDPEVHGEAVYCLRTKARLQPGDPMVICAGSPDADCGMKYAAAAWSDSMPCHHCGTLPGAHDWRPPEATDRSSLATLLQMARGE